MSYFDKLEKLGFFVLMLDNALGTTTMFAMRKGEDVGGDVFQFAENLPEWRVVDFSGDDDEKGAKMLYEKLTCSGDYAKWDERIGGLMGADDDSVLIGFEHRPESERFQPVD